MRAPCRRRVYARRSGRLASTRTPRRSRSSREPRRRAEQGLDPRKALLALGRQLACCSDDLTERLVRLLDIGLVGLEQLRQGGDRALLVQKNEPELNVEHFAELRGAQLLVGLPALADPSQHPVSALVERSVGSPHIDERTQDGLLDSALVEFPVEIRAHFGGGCVADEIARHRWRRPITRRTQTERRLKKRRAISGEEKRLGHAVAD